MNPNIYKTEYMPQWVEAPKITWKGWECPKCGRVYAPIVVQCYYCGSNPIKTESEE